MTLEKWHCGVPYFSFSRTSRSNLLRWQVNQCFSNWQHFSSAWELEIKLCYFFLLFHGSRCQPSKPRWHYCLRSAGWNPAPSRTERCRAFLISSKLIASAWAWVSGWQFSKAEVLSTGGCCGLTWLVSLFIFFKQEMIPFLCGSCAYYKVSTIQIEKPQLRLWLVL